MMPGCETARALRAADLALHRQTNACFADDGMTADQFVVLSALADAYGVTQQDLVRRVNSDPNRVRAIPPLPEGRGSAKGPVSMIVRLHYADGTTEGHALKNGEEDRADRVRQGARRDRPGRDGGHRGTAGVMGLRAPRGPGRRARRTLCLRRGAGPLGGAPPFRRGLRMSGNVRYCPHKRRC
jgi:hypothetical protein